MWVSRLDWASHSDTANLGELPMKYVDDVSGVTLLALWRFTVNVYLTAFRILFLLSLAVSSVAIAGNLDRVASFDIKAQTLEMALVEFGVQAHVQVMFESKASMDRIRTTALKGKYTARQALMNLLRGSSWGFMENGDTTVIVPSAQKSSKMRGRNGGQADRNKSKTAPTHTNTEPSKALDPPEKGSAATRKFPALPEVVVTGTHIRGAPVSSPLTRISRQEIDRSGYTTAGALIQSLPNNFGDSGPQTNIGAAPSQSGSVSGAPAPNLYGLGSASTLTLVDGQRLAIDGTTGSVDISLIPLPVIDHIDILSGGASAVYGSDAVAGVVNFVLKKKFRGSETRLLGGGTADGGGTERDVNEMLGETWSEGGAIFDYEYYSQDPILASQRSYTNTNPAARLTTTLAGTSRSSFFVSTHQSFGEDVSAYVTGLYTHRLTNDAFSNGSQYPSTTADENVHQFAADGGVNIVMPSDWFLAIVGDYSENRTEVAQAVLTSPREPATLLLEGGQERSVEATANGPILTIWSGKVRAAAGLGYRREAYNFAQRNVSGVTGARRTVRYAYGEVDTPLLTPSTTTWRRELVLNLSGRVERYSDFGEESVPKIGLVYAPFSTISVRGTWGKAFRAPSLYQMHAVQQLLYFPRSDPLSKTGVSDVLESLGGNPGLEPETARTWTLGIDYASKTVDGLRASVTYFDVTYRGRIGKITDPGNALINPLDAPFVIRDPSEALVESLLNSASHVINIVGRPINPANVPAIINARNINVASEDVRGGDVDLRYRVALGLWKIEPFISTALLDERQKLVPGAPEVEISGRVFEPPKVRARAGMSWLVQRLAITGIVNYNGAEINTYQPGYPHVASWTTLDFDLAWRPEKSGALGGLTLSVAVQNAFNRNPPFVEFDEFVPGIHYDSLNANVFGRVIRVGASWLLQ